MTGIFDKTDYRKKTQRLCELLKTNSITKDLHDYHFTTMFIDMMMEEPAYVGCAIREDELLPFVAANIDKNKSLGADVGLGFVGKTFLVFYKKPSEQNINNYELHFSPLKKTPYDRDLSSIVDVRMSPYSFTGTVYLGQDDNPFEIAYIDIDRKQRNENFVMEHFCRALRSLR